MASFNCNSQSLVRCRLSNIFFNASEIKLKVGANENVSEIGQCLPGCCCCVHCAESPVNVSLLTETSSPTKQSLQFNLTGGQLLNDQKCNKYQLDSRCRCC